MMKITRREFIQRSTQLSAAAMLTGVVGMGTLTGCDLDDDNGSGKSHPNILLIMVDQMQTPPEGYSPDEGPAQGLKEILGFRELSSDNPYARFFPGLLRLRQNAVVMRKHYTASSACVPSRTCIMTGQYPCVTGVDQTDGLFKSAGDVKWLDPEGIPTIGDWFRAVGYKTHYFGKWHVSDPEMPDYLEPWGFADWEQSAPEPHGGPADNLGAFRDVEFTKSVVEFLEKKGRESSRQPWFAVGSIVNPHDCSAFPVNWQVPGDPAQGVVSWQDYPPPVTIPEKDETSRLGGINGANEVVLNPDGFPQENSTLPRTYTESLDDKPRCQKDYSLKWGLAWESLLNTILKPDHAAPFPFQLQGEDAEAWSLRYNQFYFYLHYLADLQLRQILQAVDDNGLTNNTVIVFLSDHGDMTGAHGGMIQKWHQAYEEAIRVPMVFSSPLVNKNKSRMREIFQPTSSIDFAPTVLALAGYDEASVRPVMETRHGAAVVKPFSGADLSSHIKGKSAGDILGPDGKPRKGVFFMTNDMITDRIDNPEDPNSVLLYGLFMSNVNKRITEGHPLADGPVRQPNNIRAFCTGDWKIARYVDPTGIEADEWELYCLTTDPVEQTNLLDYRTGEVREDLNVSGMSLGELRVKAAELKAALAKQEALCMGV